MKTIQVSEDESYYETLLNEELYTVPPDLGDPDMKNQPYPSNDGLGIPQDHLEALEPNEEEENESPQDELREILQEENDKSLASEDTSPSLEFINHRGLPDGDDSASWDDTSRPVQPVIKPQPAPGPHFHTAVKTAQKYVPRVGSIFTASRHSRNSKHTEAEAQASRQWSVHDGIYRAVGKTVSSIPPGLYALDEDMMGWYLEARELLSDDIIKLPDDPSSLVVEGIRKFRAARHKYVEHGLIHKRGVLMWGPQAGGKTTTVNNISSDLIANGDIVIMCNTSPRLLSLAMNGVRQIEADRHILAVLEDCDDILSYYGEHALLALLDGENQIGGCTYLATTNFPERLGARLLNRPSRFDQRVFIPMPTIAARTAYIRHASKGKLNDTEIAKWAKDTNGFSIAHIKEMIISILILDHSYAETLTTLQGMGIKPSSHDFNQGFTG